MQIIGQEVHCMNCNVTPEDHETIADYMDIDEVIKHAKDVIWYRREKRDCPFGRGNWIIDLPMKTGEMICAKYPLEMSHEQFLKFIKPLIDAFNAERRH